MSKSATQLRSKDLRSLVWIILNLSQFQTLLFILSEPFDHVLKLARDFLKLSIVLVIILHPQIVLFHGINLDVFEFLEYFLHFEDVGTQLVDGLAYLLPHSLILFTVEISIGIPVDLTPIETLVVLDHLDGVSEMRGEDLRCCSELLWGCLCLGVCWWFHCLLLYTHLCSRGVPTRTRDEFRILNGRMVMRVENNESDLLKSLLEH